MRAGQKGQPAVVFDDAIVVLGKPELAERIVERAARGDKKHRHMQTAAGLRCFALGHLILSPPQQDSAHADLGTLSLGQPSRLSPWRLIRTSRWMPIFISTPNPTSTAIIAVPP